MILWEYFEHMLKKELCFVPDFGQVVVYVFSPGWLAVWPALSPGHTLPPGPNYKLKTVSLLSPTNEKDGYRVREASEGS